MTLPHTQACPIAGALNLLGDRWTLLIVREAFYGVSRFGQFQSNTGMAKNLLSDRLRTLLDCGILEKHECKDRGTRYAYHLTDKGQSLKTVMVALHQWGNAHVFGQGAEPVLLVERETGRELPALQITSTSGVVLDSDDVIFRPGPGANKAVLRRLNNFYDH